MNTETVDRLNLCLPGYAMRSSAMEQRAAEVERETVKLKKAQYMESRTGETYSGVISGITGWGIYVELPDTVEGMIRISDLTDDFYAYDEKQYILVGEYTGRKYMLGQKMDIMVAGADTMRRTIDFVPVQNGEPMQAPRRDRGREDKKPYVNERNDKGGRRLKKKGPLMDRTGRVLSGRAGKLRGKKGHKRRREKGDRR